MPLAQPSKFHKYITTALVAVSVALLVYRLLRYVRRVILLRVTKIEAPKVLDTENGILRAAVNAVGSSTKSDSNKKSGRK